MMSGMLLWKQELPKPPLPILTGENFTEYKNYSANVAKK